MKFFKEQEAFKLFFETAPFPMMIFDQKGILEDINRSGLLDCEYTKDEIIGKNMSFIFPVFASVEGRIHFLNVLDKGHHYGEATIITKSNKIIHYKVFGIRIGEYVLGISFNITDEKITTDKLKESEEKYRAYIKNAPVGHFIMNNKGEFIEVNLEASNQVDFPQEYLLQKKAQDFFSPKNPDLGLNHMKELIQNGKASGDVMVRDAHGKDHYYRMNGIQIEKDRYLLFSSETSELKEAQKQLEEANSRLKAAIELLKVQQEELEIAKQKAEESDRMKSAFLANMSHEIRTPMNSIIGFAELMHEQTFSEEKQKKYLKIISSRSKDLLQIINDIIDVSKIESNQMNINKELITVDTILDDLYDLYLYDKRLNGKNIKYSLIKPSHKKEVLVETDPIRLKQILNNLISNALKFTDDGFVEFGYQVIDGHVQFFVKDSGIGISEEQQERIFKRFTQAERTTSIIYGGTGLGLSICKSLVQMLDGDIWVESSVNEGSCFFFTIPRIMNRSKMINNC